MHCTAIQGQEGLTGCSNRGEMGAGRGRKPERCPFLFLFNTGASSLCAGRSWGFDRSEAEKAYAIKRVFKIIGRMEEDAGRPLTLVK